MILDMYAEQILDLYKNPRNFGRLDKPDLVSRDTNPLCGDEVELQASIKNSKIEKAMFTGKGCAISQASASLLTEMVIGKTVKQVLEIKQAEMISTLGVEISAARMKCAMLGLRTLQKGLLGYNAK